MTNTRAESAAPRRSSFLFCMCLPRVSYRALPSFHPGLCRSAVPEALVISLNFDALALTSKVQCIHRNKYDVLTDVSTRTYISEYTHLLSRVRRTYN